MKFNILDIGNFFTWWESSQHLTGIKTGERQAFCLNTREFVAIHHNKDVKEVEKIPEDLELKFGRDGQAFLCSPANDGKVLARRVLLVGGEIMHETDLKTVSHRKDGGEPENAEQVYIMYQLALKKLAELEKVLSVVGIMISDGLSVGSSDNRIMSTSPFIKGRELTE
ncbi:MAG: hypothetical protein EHM30_00035 [Desulfobacteraceae bacterium]|nr:MAG: hypothetical protein EHM30_00035 [Desulfobacteraceae bacterium]